MGGETNTQPVANPEANMLSLSPDVGFDIMGMASNFPCKMGTLVTMATGMPKRCPVKSFERPQTFIRGGHGHANEHLTSTELVGTLQNQAASE